MRGDYWLLEDDRVENKTTNEKLVFSSWLPLEERWKLDFFFVVLVDLLLP